MPVRSPQILDVTVRDGSYLIDHRFTPKMVAEIARGLQDAGCSYTEISHGWGIGAQAMGYPVLADDEELLNAARTAAPELQIAVFIPPVSLALAVIPGIVDFFEIGRIGLNVNQVAEGEKFIQKLKKYHKKVSVQLVRTHARSPEFVAAAAKQAYEMGADIIYAVDSFGSMKPDDAVTYVKAIESKTKVEIGFHGHNNLGLALANTLAAWKAGATWLDASLMGVGRGAGNVIFETLVFQLQNQGHCKEINLKKLCDATQETVLPIFLRPPLPQYIDFLFALEKLDYQNPRLLELSASMLHVPLEVLLNTIHNKMRDEVMMQDAHLKAVLQEEGVSLDQILSLMTKKENPKSKVQG